MKPTQTRSPWFWIPTLYFAEGIPYFIVNNISVIMFTRLGVPNETMALYTGLLYLPWTIKPLWSPFVDILKTKRWWIVAMQALMTLAFVLLALSIPFDLSPDTIASRETPVGLFTFTLILFLITAFASATHDIAADGFYMLALSEKSQSFFVGIRSTFYRLSSIFGQGILVYVAGVLEESTDNIPLAWRLTLMGTAILFAAITLYHTFFIPKPLQDAPRMTSAGEPARGANEILREFGLAFATFFKKAGVLTAMLFLLLYRFPEALMLKMVSPFFLDGPQAGGMGLTTKEIGIVYGTIGIIALTLGGIFGGVYASRKGLRRSLWPMALALTLPCAVYVYMGLCHPSGIGIVSACVAEEQFGYGYGFTAY
ncbi:MAG: MFS transporter, partial [Bacteroidales bacterium]|nr:MFS transporter [Bacteroidales bacterium]